MSDDMAEFIKRKRQSESKTDDGMDEKERKRLEIMKRVEERRKQREQEGSGVKAASAGASKLNEELKRKDAEHQKEVFEMRKNIEELRNQITKLQSEARNAEQLSKTVEDKNSEIASLQKQVQDYKEEKESIESQISSIKAENENQIKAIQKERDTFKSDKIALDSVVSNLQQQVDSLTELQKSEASSDDKISQITEELNDKTNEIALLKKSSELDALEKDQLKDMLQEQETIANEQTSIISKMKEDYNYNINLEKKRADELSESNKKLRATVDELTAQIAELQDSLNYEKSVVESQEKKMRDLVDAQNRVMDAAAQSDNREVPSSPSTSNQNSAEVNTNPSVRPSDSFEAALVSEINLLRKNPDSYADHLVDLIECYNGLQFKTKGSDHTFDTKEGVSALEDAIEYLQNCQHSCPPLVLKDGLCQSAQYLCDQNGASGSVDSTCADGYVFY